MTEAKAFDFASVANRDWRTIRSGTVKSPHPADDGAPVKFFYHTPSADLLGRLDTAQQLMRSNATTTKGLQEKVASGESAEAVRAANEQFDLMFESAGVFLTGVLCTSNGEPIYKDFEDFHNRAYGNPALLGFFGDIIQVVGKELLAEKKNKAKTPSPPKKKSSAGSQSRGASRRRK